MAITPLDMGIIRNMMLTHSYKDIASTVDVTAEEVKACIVQMITGTAIVTRQMVLDQKKPKSKIQKIKKRKPKPKTEKRIKEDWEKVKKERVDTQWEQRRIDNGKRFSRSVLKTRHVDLSKLVRVQIDNRTSIFIKPGESKEAAIAKFYKNRIDQKKPKRFIKNERLRK